MIATLILASAHLAAPMTADSVNFVNNYKKNDKATYDIAFSSETQGLDLYGEFELAIKSELKEGKMGSLFTFNKLEMDGQDLSSMFPPMELELNSYGVPNRLESMEESNVIALVTLLSTYLPNEKLEQGEKFAIKLEKEGFQYLGSGRFTGQQKKKDKQYAVLDFSGSVLIDEIEISAEIKSFYDSKAMRVVYTEAIFETPDDVFNIDLTLKK